MFMVISGPTRWMDMYCLGCVLPVHIKCTNGIWAATQMHLDVAHTAPQIVFTLPLTMPEHFLVGACFLRSWPEANPSCVAVLALLPSSGSVWITLVAAYLLAKLPARDMHMSISECADFDTQSVCRQSKTW